MFLSKGEESNVQPVGESVSVKESVLAETEKKLEPEKKNIYTVRLSTILREM